MGVARTPAYQKEYKGAGGSGRMILLNFTEVDDGDTFDPSIDALTSSPFFLTGWIGDPSTQGSGGGHVAYDAGAFTFHPSSDNLGCNLAIFL